MTRILSEDELRKNAKSFEFYFLLPKEGFKKELDIRLRIESAWLGPTLREDVLKCLGLEVGETIMAHVKPLYLNGLIGNTNEIIMFAEKDTAHWIIDQNVIRGCVLDGRIRISYINAEAEGCSTCQTAVLILEEGYDIVPLPNEDTSEADDALFVLFEKLRDSNNY